MKYNKYLFDLDGVLVNTVSLQIKATQQAIYDITNKNIDDKILKTTITTLDKLKYLYKNNIIKKDDINKIYELKKKIFNDNINLITIEEDKIQLLKFLKKKNCKIGIVTNSNKHSANLILKKMELLEYCDFVITNNDVNNYKPHSEPYIRAISHFGGKLEEYIIFEDSEAGIQSAKGTGIYVYPVKNVQEINIDLIYKLNNINLNIVIPMGGLGQRFKNRGFKKDKPLIEINGIPMILKALESLNIVGNYHFIIRKTNIDQFNKLTSILKQFDKNCNIISIDYLTEGSASSCYLVKDFINNDDELIITNCDQYLEWDSKLFLDESRRKNYDCSLLTYKSDNIKNSFVKSSNNIAENIIEKKIISNQALVGLHYFKKGRYFIESYENIFNKKEKIKNEYYLSTVCNNMICKYRVGCIDIKENENYYSLGTPEDLFLFIKKKCGGNILKSNLNDMFRGWFIGNFEPSILKTSNFEVGYLFHKKGEKWDNHYHKKVDEINLLTNGKMILNDMELNKNDIFVIKKNQIACPIFLEDCNILCVKIPSIPGDKFIL
jgi:HAD superfamily hydrolase (TIGR01509 family)